MIVEVHLTPEQQSRLQQTAERVGRDAQELVAVAVDRFLAEEERVAEELRAAIDAGDEDIESGHYTDYTEQTIGELFNDVRRRGRARLMADSEPQQ